MSHFRMSASMPRFVLSLAAAMALVGCSAVTVDESLTQSLGGNEPSVQLEFWHTLNGRPVASNDEALHALLLFIEGQDPAEDYAARVEIFKQRGLLPQGFAEPADQAVKRGTLAVVLLKLLKIEGGLTLRLFGPVPRYAVRELQYEGIYPPSSPHQTFTGKQFVSLIGRVEDYQKLNEIDLPAAQLPK